MPRGNGKHSQQAQLSGKLSAFIKKDGHTGHKANVPDHVNWGVIEPELLAGAVTAVNMAGGSLLLGHTRDNASFSVMVFFDGGKTPYYFPCTENGLLDLRAFMYNLSTVAPDASDDTEGQLETLF